MEHNSVYKHLNKERDVLYVQTVERESLFYPRTGLVKPYESSNNLELSDIDQPEDGAYTKVTVVKDSNAQVSQLSYFSFARAIKNETASADESIGAHMMYSQMKQLTRPDQTEFFIQDGYSIKEFDVLAVSREFYKDKVDPKFFGVFINTVASEPTSAVNASFSTTNDILGLFPSVDSTQSKMGEKRYLYPTTSSEEYYNTSSDTFSMATEVQLDKEVPYGELYTEAGIVILFTEVIKLEHPNITDDTLLHYLAGVAGRSEIQLNSVLYYLRMYNEEFNYTTNPTFYEDVDDNIVKKEFRDDPTTFVTGVGLYNNAGDLIAVGKLSKPVLKNFQREAIIYAQLSL